MYVVWAFIVILLFLHFDLSEIIAFAHYTSTASPLQKHAHYPCFTLVYTDTLIHYRARGDCNIWHSDNVPAGGADPGLLHDGAPRAESQEEGDGDAEEDSEGWRRPVQLLLNYQRTLQVDF